MRVVVLTPASNVSGGNIRVLEVVSRFPGDVTLAMPRNRKRVFLREVREKLGERYAEIVEGALELPDLPESCVPLGAFRYSLNVFKVVDALRGVKADLYYVPHEDVYLALGLRRLGRPWTSLLQLTPVIGCLLLSRGRSVIEILRDNYRVVFFERVGTYTLLKRFVKLKLVEHVYKGVKVLAVSKAIEHDLRVLNIAVDVEAVFPGVATDVEPVKGVERDIDILFFTRLLPEKGIFEALYVIKNVLELTRSRRFRVVFAGSYSEYVPVLIELLRKLGIRAEVYTNLPRGKAVELLSRAKVLLYPSKMDSVSITVLEALRCGTPAVTFDIPAIRLNYRTPAVRRVKILDLRGMAREVVNVLEDERLWKRLSAEAKRYASLFTWDSVAQAEWRALEKAYEAWGSR